MNTTTINKLKQHEECNLLVEKIKNKFKSEDEEISLKELLHLTDIYDAISSLRSIDDKKSVVTFAIYCARCVLPILKERYANIRGPERLINAAYHIINSNASSTNSIIQDVVKSDSIDNVKYIRSEVSTYIYYLYQEDEVTEDYDRILQKLEICRSASYAAHAAYFCYSASVALHTMNCAGIDDDMFSDLVHKLAQNVFYCSSSAIVYQNEISEYSYKKLITSKFVEFFL